MTHAIEINNLSCRFGRKEAVHNLTLRVPQGSIFAFLGPNGAGKTTTIKMLMNLIVPDSGSASVLQCDSRKLCSAQFQRIGYVSENQKLPEWMTVSRLINYCRPFYSGWDDVFCASLLKKFHLPGDQKIRDLSRGMKGKIALLISLAFRPELLVLDEPFNGFDPLVKTEFISGMLDLVERRPWTSFISSHDIDEVERLADWVGIIHDGKLILCDPVEAVLLRYRKIEFTFEGTPNSDVPHLSDWQLVETSSHTIRLVHIKYRSGESEGELSRRYPGAKNFIAQEMTLREIFITLSRTHHIHDF